MGKESFTKFIKSTQKALTKHSPEILTGLGVAGMITTTILAVKATPRVLEIINDAEIDKVNAQLDEGKDSDQIVEKLTKMETVKVAWKPYLPAIVTGVASVACIIGASSVHVRRNAALATAYQLSTTALNEYKEKVVETIGEKKEQVIREKIAQDKVNKNPVSKNEVVVIGSKDVIFLEPVSMRYFTSDIETLRKIQNDLNYRLTSGMEEYISLSEFYDEIGLSHTSNSDDLGWNLGRDGQIEINFPATTLEDGRPCLMLEYQVSPRYDYRHLM